MTVDIAARNAAARAQADATAARLAVGRLALQLAHERLADSSRRRGERIARERRTAADRDADALALARAVTRGRG